MPPIGKNASMVRGARAAVKRGSRPPATARTTVSAGPLSGAINALDRRTAQAQSISRRRLQDQRRHQRWLASNQRRFGREGRAADSRLDDRQSDIQNTTSAAQAAAAQRLDAARGARQSTVTANSGISRAGLADDENFTQSLLSATRQKSAESARSGDQKGAFLQAATDAAGAAQGQRIRGESRQEQDALDAERTTLLARRDEIQRQEAAAARQAAAAIEAAKIQAQSEQAALEAQFALKAMDLDSADRLNRRDNRTRLKSSRASGGLSPAARAAAAREVRGYTTRLDAAIDHIRRGKGSQAAARKFIAENMPELGVVGSNAIVSAVYDKRGNGRPYGQAAKDLQAFLNQLASGG